MNAVLNITAKIQSLEAATQTVASWKAVGNQVVFTNGCFDLLHYGHIQYLADARALGQRLVVGLNSSASVSALTVYDMLKAAEKSMCITDLHLTLKDGGKSGRYEPK